MQANSKRVQTEPLRVRVAQLGNIAEGVVCLVLKPVADAALPGFEPGAHIDVFLPNGMVRQYSLTNESERHRYVVAVGLDPNGRGGSAFIHDKLAVGDEIAVSVPRNNFSMDATEQPVVLVAGGIGITPIWCMVQRLERQGRPWALYYCARTRCHAAFWQELQALAASSQVGKLHAHFDQEPGQSMLDLGTLLASHTPGNHFYCCGPKPMLDAFTAAAKAAGIAADNTHVEYFSAQPLDSGGDRGFEVELSNATTHFVPPGKSILDVLLEAGESVMYSCTEGICGSCETTVLAGEPLHRDSVLSATERASNKSMMICVSRCHGEKLKLDL